MDYTDLVITSLPIQQSQLITNHIRYTKIMPLTRWIDSKKVTVTLPKIGSIIATRNIGTTDKYSLSIVTSIQLPATDRQWMKASPILYFTHKHLNSSMHKVFIEYMNTHNLSLHKVPLLHNQVSDNQSLWTQSF